MAAGVSLGEMERRIRESSQIGERRLARKMDDEIAAGHGSNRGTAQGPFRLPPPATLHHWVSGPPAQAQPSPPLPYLPSWGSAWASCQLPVALFGFLPTSHPITEMRLSVAHLSHRLTILWKD